MKVKIFYGSDISKIESEANKFMERKTVSDIKLNSSMYEGPETVYITYSIMVAYEE